MDAPFIAAIGACVRRIAVRGIITRHKIGLAALLVFEGNIQAVVQKWIGISRFTRLWSVECQRNFVPFPEFSADLSARHSLAPNDRHQC